MNTLTALAAWANDNRALFLAISWPFLLGLFTLICKPKTPEQYAAIAKVSPRLAGLLQFIGTLGIDPTKAATVFVQKIAKGNVEPLPVAPPPPSGPSVLPLIPLGLVALFAISNAACARVLAAADLFAEKAQCAVAHQNLTDAQIVTECAIEPGDVDKVLAIVGDARNQSALEANHAAAIQQQKDQTAGLCH